ncbi:MAG: GTPase ObgE [Endomicrobia bacterium]|nr:GTPase ObgE [Endomicrobiia bacterium]
MFVDRVKIFVESGKGGDGCVSFRREKFVPLGGPDGGNGGKGGDVYLRANPEMTTLYDFVLRPHYKAENGQHGRGKNMVGKDGKDLYIDVPCGTVVYKLTSEGKQELVADLSKPYQTILVARGGRGGRGNAMFKSSTNRTPRVAELGQPGEKVTLVLELKLIADVGIIGLPNVGKSTLLSIITKAKPKIADYPFTTLSPNLGVLEYDYNYKIVFADIPGLIEDAHKGKGLGTDFLRHIERTKVLLHLIDISSRKITKIYKDYNIVINELKSYSEMLVQKPMIVVLNKADLIGKDEVEVIVKKFKNKIKSKHEILAISAVNKQNIDIMLKKIVKLIHSLKHQKEYTQVLSKDVQKVFAYKEIFTVEKHEDRFIVKGKKVEDIVKMTDFSSQDSIKRLQKIFKQLGVEKKLKQYGIKEGDIVEIADVEFTYFE